jgi:hypothetical protein
MPYRISRNTVRPFVVRHRVRGLSGLGDYSQWLSNISIVDQNGQSLTYSSASAVEQSQILNALGATTYFGEPPGTTIRLTVNSGGGSNDRAGYTMVVPPNYAPFSGTTSDVYHANVGGADARSLNVMTCGRASCAPPSNAGGVLSSSLPANFQVAQVAPTAAQIAAAFPTTTTPSGQTVISSNAPPGTSTVSLPASSSSGIPLWVWLLGGGAVLWFLMSGGKSK